MLDLKTARRELWDFCSSLPYDESNASEVLKVNGKINVASSRFFTSGSFRGTLQRAVISAYDNQVTSPRELQTLLAYNLNSGCGSSLIRPIWYDFIAGTCCGSINGLTDLGEGFCTYRDFPSEDLQIVIRSGEAGDSASVLTIVVQNSTGYAQVDVPLNVAATQVDTPLTSKIIRLSKPVTTGKILVYYVENGTETLCASLKPSETDANYRRYKVSSGTATIDSQWKRAWLPALADIEAIVPNSIDALTEMLLALQYRSKNDRERYKDALEQAIQIANDDRQQFDGDSQTPIYNVTRGFGAADIALPGYYTGDYIAGHYP